MMLFYEANKMYSHNRAPRYRSSRMLQVRLPMRSILNLEPAGGESLF